MGEYATYHMMHAYKQMTGIDADQSDFENTPQPRKVRPVCRKCGKHFGSDQAVADHTRDKHATQGSKP